LDGLLGTGIKLPLKAEIAQVLSTAQEIISSLDEPPVVIAVDCPSGVDSDTGQAAAETIPADLTVCMAAVKMGLLAFPALGLVGEMTCVDIGLTNKVPEWTGTRRSVVDAEMVQEALPARKMDAHKGTYGTALLVVGSVNFTGAAYLSAEAAYRVGTGLVTLATPSTLHQALAGQIPEATWLLLPHELGVISESAVDVVREQTEKAEALLLGPGWGMEETTQFFLERLLQVKDAPAPHAIGFVRSQRSGIESPNNQLPPRVIDADGLKLLAKIKDWPTYLNEQTVLTPHPGEMAVLTGQQIRDIQVDRIQIAEKYAREWKKVVVLKGAATVIANPDGRSAVVPIATSALAKGGTGDVLAGMITGLLAQGMEAYPAAYCGAWLHAQAGLSALEEIGNPASVLAGDVALAIPEVFNQLGIVDRL
jgi:NAD(P)H-hydrate epimerase